MGQTDDRRDRTLPVTAEVGSEGGSYADPTYQVATFGDETEPRTIDPAGVQSDAAGEGVDFASVRGGGAGTAPDPDAGMIRYPTEPPVPPAAREGWKAGSRWRSIAAGAAAGAAGAALVRLARNRKRE